MKNREIIKNSILFPIRNYKEFIIITLLFLLTELIQEHFPHEINDAFTILPAFFVFIILPLLVLGINLQIIFHLIGENSGLPNLSFKKSLKEAMHDVLLESYYYILTILITVILAIPTGIFTHFVEISGQLNNISIEIEEMNVIQVIGSLPDLILYDSQTLIICLLIFIITLIFMFSMCTLGKIDIEKNHNFKQALNIRYIFSLIKKIGILKYLEFMLLVIIICVMVANIVFILNFSEILGSIISSCLESLSLFFFLNSFAQLYPN